VILCTSFKATAQATSQVVAPAHSTQSQDGQQPVPQVPGLSTVWRGFNAGFTFSQVHDSSAGWYNLITPAVSYRFSRHYSADASVSIYPYRRVQTGYGPAPQMVTDHGDTSDMVAGLHASFANHDWRTTTTLLGTAPTGDRSAGLGAGKFTFDLSERVDRYFDRGSLMVDLGGGDTSGLFNRQVTQDQTSVGPVVHFAAGGVLYLPWSWYLQSVAYELLPTGQQTVYAAENPPAVGLAQLPAFTGTGISEENGFTTTLGMPLSDHITLWSYYNRSLRQSTDTVSVGITYVVRPVIRRGRLSMIDRALREAEEENH
jgi:hypothetical protein